MSAMQVKIALKEAQRRWGETAAVERRKCRLYTGGKDAGKCSAWFDRHRNCHGGVTVCKVGSIQMGMFFSVKGAGESFEDAFRDADNRAAGDRARYCRARASHGQTRRCRVCKYRGPPEREGLGELQEDGTLLTTDERVTAWVKERDDARAKREARLAAGHPSAPPPGDGFERAGGER